jgi:hypothetical protein
MRSCLVEMVARLLSRPAMDGDASVVVFDTNWYGLARVVGRALSSTNYFLGAYCSITINIRFSLL